MTSELTPYRKTHVRFDVAMPVVTEFPYAMRRSGAEIARGGPEATGSQNVHLLTTGAWALEPLQERTHQITERTDPTNAIIPKAHFLLAPTIVSQKRFRKSSDLVGVTYDPGVQESGDPFYVKSPAAGQTWNQSLESDIASFGQPTLPTQNAPMDRVAVGNVTYPAEQPYYLRWEVPGTKQHSPDSIKTFYFGGPATPDGSGQYCITFGGMGFATLFERVNDTWASRDIWRYAEPHRICDAVHSMRIWPHTTPDGRSFIEFRSSLTESAPAAGQSFVQGVYVAPSSPRSHIYSIPFVSAALRPFATGPGPIRIDHRRDLRVRWQPSLLRYQAAGTLFDWTLQIPFIVEQLLTLTWSATIPDGCNLVGKLMDATTLAELSLVSVGPNFAIYTPNAGQPNYIGRFEFTSNAEQSATPLLWSYEVVKDGAIDVNAPGEFEAALEPAGKLINSALVSLSISGPERDPSHETANVEIEDYTGRLLTLNERASIAGIIETEYDPNDSSLRSVLHNGLAERITATRKGMPQGGSGINGSGGAADYPSADWRHYQAAFLGVWKRLFEARTFFRKALAPDPQVTTDSVPYKVTDVIRAAFGWAGFPDSMIDVPDLPIRFFPGGGSGEELSIEPGMSIGELILQWCRDYLFYFMVWDGNAGTDGMFRLRPPATSPYTNLATFTTSMVPGTLAHRPESYGSPNWVGTNPTAFIKQGSLQTWVKAPEANAVFVCGGGDTLNNHAGQLLISNWLINYGSLNNPRLEDGSPNPDYIGRLVPLIVVDTSLGTQEAVDWFTVSYFLKTCFAIKMASFEAPLVLITDPADALQAAPRPLRYYDPVSIINDGTPGQFLMRNCNPAYTHDAHQWARYEVESPRV